MVVPVLLIIHGDARPGSFGWRVVPVHICGFSVQGDRFKQKMTVRSALHLNGQMIPLVVLWPAANACRMPLLVRIIPNVPLIAACDPAFVSPDVRLTVQKLVDVELQGLRGVQVFGKEINVIHKIVRVGIDVIVAIPHPLGRELADQVIIPKYVRVLGLAANGELHSSAAE